jgi:hypothetical protein
MLWKAYKHDLCIAVESYSVGARLILDECTEERNALWAALTLPGFSSYGWVDEADETVLCWNAPNGNISDGARPELAVCTPNPTHSASQTWSVFTAEVTISDPNPPSIIWSVAPLPNTNGTAFQCFEVTDGAFYAGAEIQFGRCDMNKLDSMGFVWVDEV